MNVIFVSLSFVNHIFLTRTKTPIDTQEGGKKRERDRDREKREI